MTTKRHSALINPVLTLSPLPALDQEAGHGDTYLGVVLLYLYLTVVLILSSTKILFELFHLIYSDTGYLGSTV